MHSDTGSAREVAFERLHHQFEHRRQEKANWLAKHVAEVDIEEFTHELPKGQGDNNTVSFELCGALPPTVRHYGRDIPSWVAIGHAERQAAKELIEKQKAADKAAIEASANSVRSPRSEAKPTSWAGLGGMGGLRQRYSTLTTTTGVLPKQARDSILDQGNIQAKSPFGIQKQPALTGAAAQQWEARIAEFYRRWELRRTEEHMAEARAEQKEMDDRHQDLVRARHFEKNHEQRAMAIRNDAKRLDIRMSHEEYRQSIEEQLTRQALQRSEYLAKAREDHLIEKDKASMRKSARESANAFISQGLSLEKTCRRIDLWKGRVQEHAEASEKIDEEKVQRLARSGRLASHRALCEAQKRRVEAGQKKKDKYLMKRAKERVEQNADEVRRHVAEERAQDRYIREKRFEFEQIALQSQQADLDACGYEQTLCALKDLAEGVKVHSSMMKEALHAANGQAEDLLDEDGDIIPLLDSEPQVRAALGCSSPSQLEELFPQLPEDVDEECDDITNESSTVASPRGCSKEIQETPSTRAPTRTSKTPSRPTSRANRTSPSPLLVRPMMDLHQQASGHASSVPKKGTPRGDSAQSLAALRMIRRTGPLIKR